MTTISDKDRADAQAMAETLAHMLEARDNARAEVERLTAIVNSDVFEATRGGVAELRRLAEGADDEYWYSDDELRSYIDHDKANVDVPFILAASPDVVLSLLDRLAHMAEARDNARAEVERLTAIVNSDVFEATRGGVDADSLFPEQPITPSELGAEA